MFRKCLFSAALKHTSQQLIKSLQQLEDRREDFELVETIALELVAVGVDASAAFHPPATPFLRVNGWGVADVETRLKSVASTLGLAVARNGTEGWLLVATGAGGPKLAIEVAAS
ncbi:hypothetical protein [Chromobacterium haemolyticum]|uniref:hypothetical protein n=1 Tax=Chromobacterium TaxID=535 RepID=UPI0040572A3B